MHTLRAYPVHVTISFAICLDVVLRVFICKSNNVVCVTKREKHSMDDRSVCHHLLQYNLQYFLLSGADE